MVGFVGVVLAGGPDVPHDDAEAREAHVKSIVLALVAALGFGGSFVCLAGGGEFSVGMTLLVQRSTSVLLMVVPVVVFTRLAGLRWRDLPGLAGVGAGDAAANGAFAWSSTFGLLSVTVGARLALPGGHPAAGPDRARGAADPAAAVRRRSLALVGIVLLAAG